METSQYDLDFTVVGHKHDRPYPCRCGCQFVEGLTGTVVEVDFPLNLCIAAFDVPHPAGGASRRQLVAYDIEEAL